MSNVGGTRPESRQVSTIQTPKGLALVMADKISSVECPKCGTHIRAAQRPEIYCRFCKKEITMDSDYRFLQSSKAGMGIVSLDWSYHIDCYENAIHDGQLTGQEAVQQALSF